MGILPKTMFHVTTNFINIGFKFKNSHFTQIKKNPYLIIQFSTFRFLILLNSFSLFVTKTKSFANAWEAISKS
jgi:hypothetical protein